MSVKHKKFIKNPRESLEVQFHRIPIIQTLRIYTRLL